MSEIYIVKANGEKELFDVEKLRHSLRKLGAKDDVVEDVVMEVSANLHDGITTKEIYRDAFSVLRRKQRPIAVRYSLRKSVEMLGPTGFPFEKFIAEVFKSRGYEVETNRIVQGKCAEHEIDIAAWKDDELLLIEAKFHSNFGMKSDLKVALYVKARFDDLIGLEFEFGGKKRKATGGLLVTNTKFSQTAINYGQCQRINLIGWNYPYGETLHNMIEKSQLIPITALTTLSTNEKSRLLRDGYVISKNLVGNDVLEKMGLTGKKAQAVRDEVLTACENCVL